MRFALSFLACVITPFMAFSQEDAISKVDCRVTKSCALNGECHAVNTKVSFHFKTRANAAADEGPYELSYGNVSASLVTNPMSGTFFWAEGQEDMQFLQWIGAGSEDTEIGYATWIQVRPSIPGSVRFLTCKADSP